MSIESIIPQYDFNLAYARVLVEDVEPGQMTHIPSNGLVNHPAFTLGHLVSGSALLVEDLGGVFKMPQGWDDLFLRKGPGDPRYPDPDASKYPSREDLIQELAHQHEEVKTRMRNVSQEDWAAPFKWRFSSFMPTLFDMVAFMCINHEAMHLGQLAAWRREMGMPSALATL